MREREKEEFPAHVLNLELGSENTSIITYGPDYSDGWYYTECFLLYSNWNPTQDFPDLFLPRN